MKSKFFIFFLAIVILAGLNWFYSNLAYDSGIFFLSQDEVGRVWFSRQYIENNEFKSYDYTWLPLPFITGGLVGDALNGQFFRASTIVNHFLSFLTVLLGFLTVFVLRKNVFPAVIAGVLAITAPWQSFGGFFGFAGPHLWAGLMLTIFSLVCLSESNSLKKWYFFTVLGTVGTVSACLARYEAWLFAPGFVAGLLLILCNHAMKPDTKDREKFVIFRLPAILVAAGLVIWPIVWWLSIHAEVNGDWLRPFEESHMFVRDGVGQANQTFTAVGLFSMAIPYSIWLPVLALISLSKRKWTLGYFFLVVPVLMHLIALVYFSFSSGIGWIHGYRVIAFHSIVLAFPAGIVLEEWLTTKPEDEKERWYTQPRPIIAGGLILAIIGSNTVFTRIPIEGLFEKQKATRDYVLSLQEKRGIAPGFRVAIIPGDAILDHWALMEHKNFELVQMPQEIFNEVYNRNFDIVKNWMIENNISFFVCNHIIQDPAKLELIEECEKIDKRISYISERNDAFVLMTHFQVTKPLPESIYELLGERGLRGPDITDKTVRYRALAPPKRSGIEASEMKQVNPDDDFEDLFILIHKRPESQRGGWPGNYVIRSQPSDFGVSSVLQIGDSIVHPKHNGYYLLSFDFETGKQTDFFFVGHDNIHTDIWDKIHFPVYGISQD